MLRIILLIGFVLFSVHPIEVLPPCKKQQDTYGRWVNLSNTTYSMDYILSHFYDRKAHEALEFSDIWLPYNCSYHRFTNETILKSVEYYISNYIDLNKGLTKSRVNMIFLGDSIARGLYCSLTRILAGSEVYGPVNCKACGGKDFGKHVDSIINYPFYHLDFFGGKLHFSWCFLTSLSSPKDRVDWKLEWAVTRESPFVVSLNTGAWDFQPQWKVYPKKTPNVEECDSNQTIAVSQSRSTPHISAIYHEISGYAKSNKVKLIYRNMHHNLRFGTKCCDEKVEALLEDTVWEITDSRRLSQDIFVNQMSDGLHIDRRDTHTVEEHKLIRDAALKAGKPTPGELEMQITQSFLNTVFHEYLMSLSTPNKE